MLKQFTRIIALIMLLTHWFAHSKSTEVNSSQASGGTKEELAFQAEMKKAFERLNSLEWVQALPIENLIMMVSPDDEVVLMDAKARIAIRGDIQVYDLWNQTPIDSLITAKRAWLSTLDRFRIQAGDLATYRYGLNKPAADVHLFVDPASTFNHDLFKKMKKLQDKYSFDITLTPTLSSDSKQKAIAIWCNKDQEKSLMSLVNGKSFKSKIFATCDTKPIFNSLSILQFMHVKKLPYLVQKDGRTANGVPADLEAFLSDPLFTDVPTTDLSGADNERRK